MREFDKNSLEITKNDTQYLKIISEIKEMNRRNIALLQNIKTCSEADRSNINMVCETLSLINENYLKKLEIE